MEEAAVLQEHRQRMGSVSMLSSYLAGVGVLEYVRAGGQPVKLLRHG